MNRHLFLLTIAQGLFLTNNVAFIAMNGLVGLSLAPMPWMSTLPIMGYIVGSALSTPLVARSQKRWGRRTTFQLGIASAFFATLLGAWAVSQQSFIGLLAATLSAGYFNANAQLYRFAAAELCDIELREKAVSWVMAGGLIGAILGPNLTQLTRHWISVPFAGTYLALTGVSVLSWLVISSIEFPPPAPAAPQSRPDRSAMRILLQPGFAVAMIGGAFGYGVMNLLMSATPLAMQVCQLPFEDTAWVLQWHVIGMFAPGFITGHLIKRFGVLPVMSLGVVLNLFCVFIALSGTDLHQFTLALFLLGVGWNFLFTGSTTLAMQSYRPEEKDRAQGLMNLGVFVVTATTALASGALITAQGWDWLNGVSLLPIVVMGLAIGWLAWRRKSLA